MKLLMKESDKHPKYLKEKSLRMETALNHKQIIMNKDIYMRVRQAK